MTRNHRRWVLAGAFAAALVAPLPARACTVLDLTCTSSAIGGTALGTVDDAGAAGGDARAPGVDDAVGSAAGAIDDAVGAATGTVDDVATAVDDALDDVLAGSQPTEPGTDPRGPMPTDQDRRRGRGERERVLGRAGVEADVVTADRRHRAAPVVPVPSLAATSASASRSPARGGFGNVIAAAAPSLAVLVALFGVVMAFPLVQSWVDRRDPRLSAAPPADEMAWFR